MLQYESYYVTSLKVTGASAEEIARSVEEAVQSRALGPHEALPPIRELARTLKVSPVTVAAAYRLLRARGLVTGEGRRGTRVQPYAMVTARVHRLPPNAVDLASGNPDPALLPVLAHALRTVPSEPTLYGDAPQLRALTAFAASEFQADGIPAEALVVTGGALDATERILREHLRHGDRVAVEDPGFAPLLDLLRASGFALDPFRVDDKGPEPESFERAIRRAQAVIVTPRAQNPTGAALTASRAEALTTILDRRPDVLVIENDPFSALARERGTFLSDGSRRHWAVVRSTAKFLGPDLRLAVVSGDQATIARVQRRQALGPRWVSHVLQYLALAVWSDPAAGRQLARAAEIYAQRRDALIAALGSHGIDAQGRSGINVWIPIADEAATVQALADRGWAVAAGERFRIRAAPAIRVTTSALEPSDSERFARDLASLTRPPAAALA
jgi:DNA-binding transcriptional MocR family regulator